MVLRSIKAGLHFSGSGGFLVAGVFLGAKVDSKVVRLTRDAGLLDQ